MKSLNGEVKHTPTPWKAEKSSTGILHVRNTTNGRCQVVIAEVFENLDGVQNDELRVEAEANAQFIVKCVNSHEALVEACKKANHRLGERAGENLDVLSIIEEALKQAGEL